MSRTDQVLTLGPIHRVRGEVYLPGSKSLSNRALLLAALANGTTRVRNLLDSDDTRRMREALQGLGIALREGSDGGGAYLDVTGNGGPFQSDDEIELYLGNAGTAVRPLTAALCLGTGCYLLRGDPRMHERPIGDLTDALLPLGCDIEFIERPGYLPLRIRGTGLPGGTIRVRGDVSSQFLTALLMSAPLARAAIRIDVDGELVSKPYITITLASLAQFGVTVQHDPELRWFEITPTPLRAPTEVRVEGDASSASYFLAAAAIKGGPVRVHGIDRSSVQGDVAFIDVLQQMGATVRTGDGWIDVERGGGNALSAIDLDLNHIPDAAMTVAVTALFADGPSRIRNVWNLRVKETDRLTALSTELRKLGAVVEEGRDYLVITPPARMTPARIATYDDHRMAMAFSLAALGNVAVTIEDPDCVAKTFPEYFRLFAAICS